MCEHHMLPFEGVAHVDYRPGEKMVELSNTKTETTTREHIGTISEADRDQFREAIRRHATGPNAP